MAALTENDLYDYPYIMGEVKKLNDEIRVIMSLKYDTRITTSFGDGGGASGLSDKTGEQVVRIDEFYNQNIEMIQLKIERFMNKKRLIEEAMEHMDLLERKVIEQRYFERRSWDFIVSNIGNSRRNSISIKNNALKKIKSHAHNCTNLHTFAHKCTCSSKKP